MSDVLNPAGWGGYPGRNYGCFPHGAFDLASVGHNKRGSPYLPGFRILFKEGGLFKLCPTVGEDQGKKPEIIYAEKLLKKIQGRSHGLRSFFLMKKTDHKPGVLKEKGLDIRSMVLIVKSIHFRCGDGRIGSDKFQIVGELMSIIINWLSAFFELFSFLHGNLSAEGKIINLKVLKDSAFDVSVERLDGKAELRVVVKDLVKGLSLFQEGCDGLGNQQPFRFGKIDALPGVGQVEKISLMGVRGIVEVMIQPTAADVGTMVAGTDGTVTKGTGLFGIRRTTFRTGSARFGALLKIGADNWRIEAVARLQGSVFFDFFRDSSWILLKRTGNRSFCQSFFDALLYHFSVF